MPQDKINAAIVECLQCACESAFPPLPAAAYLSRLRSKGGWSSAELGAVEAVVTRIILSFMERRSADDLLRMS